MKINLNDAKCTELKISAPVQLAAEDDGKGGFEIEAYTGAIVDRWWGKLAIDVGGIKVNQQMPIFRGHDHDSIVGWSNKAWKDGSLFVSGQFSEATEAAKEAKALADEGFPWQASIGVRPLKILQVEEKATHIVNNKAVKGPAEVWLESEVIETSFVPLGADSNTSIATFSHFEEVEQAPGQGAETIKSMKGEKDMDITLEVLAEKAPALLEKIKADAKAEGLTEGAEAERARVKAVREQLMPGHEDLVEILMFDGKTDGPNAAVQILAAEKAIRTKAKDDLQADGIDPVDNTELQDEGKQTAKTPGEAGDKLDALTKVIMAEKGVDYGRAFDIAKAQNPELFTKYMDR